MAQQAPFKESIREHSWIYGDQAPLRDQYGSVDPQKERETEGRRLSRRLSRRERRRERRRDKEKEREREHELFDMHLLCVVFALSADMLACILCFVRPKHISATKDPKCSSHPDAVAMFPKLQLLPEQGAHFIVGKVVKYRFWL